MCGIFGIVTHTPVEVDRSVLRRGTDIVAHRGPDGFGFLLADPPTGRWELCTDPENADLPAALGFGHRRLSVIDLSVAAGQPMSTVDRALWITFNGEIFNYIELRDELRRLGHVFHTASDTEVILHAYEQWGAGCLNRFNGMWAFAIYDAKRKRLFCARDRIGVKPFYYHSGNGRFVFASEIKQLFQDPFIPREVHNGVAYDYLVYGYLDHSDRTFYSSIRQLRGGHFLQIDISGKSLLPVIERYWYVDPTCKVDKATDRNAALKVAELLRDSVSLRLRSDVPLGSCLSGGIDSSSIVCIANELLKTQGKTDIQNTFSSCFEDPRYDERNFIQSVVSKTSVHSHYVFPDPDDFFKSFDRLTWLQDEPFGSSSIFAQWSVFRLARSKGVKVMLDGQGADELLGGYHAYFSHRIGDLLKQGCLKEGARTLAELRKRHRKSAAELLMTLAGGFVRPGTRSWRISDRFFGPNRRGLLCPDFLREGEEQSEFSKIPRLPRISLLSQSLYESFFYTTLPALLHYEDRNSMAHSIESRVPFLDYRLVEYAFALPDEMKIRGAVTKWILREAMDGLLPQSVRNRNDKMGFVTPERIWLAGLFSGRVRAQVEHLPNKVFSRAKMIEMARRQGTLDRFSGSSVMWRAVSFLAWWERLAQW